MDANELDLEALWEQSPDGPPADLPAELWPMVLAGRPHAGIFRGTAGDLVVVCALASPAIRRYAEGEIAIQRAAARGAQLPRILLTFLPAPGVREGQEPLRPFAMAFELDDPGQRALWRDFASQQTSAVIYVDVTEARPVARRRLSLGAVAPQIMRMVSEADQRGIRASLPRAPR